MTVERDHRCQHCGVEYIYQASGWGAPEHNHYDWCPQCAKAVHDALEARPRLYECRYQDIRETAKYAEITLDQVLAWERQNDRERTDPIPVRRVLMPLFDLVAGDSQNAREVVGREKFQGVRFHVATWQKKPEYEIRAPMEYDIQNKRFTGHGWPR